MITFWLKIKLKPNLLKQLVSEVYFIFNFNLFVSNKVDRILLSQSFICRKFQKLVFFR